MQSEVFHLNKSFVKQSRLAQRAIELDVIRAICVILMMLHHLLYDITQLIPSIFDITGSGEALSNSYYNFAKWCNSLFLSQKMIDVRYFIVFLFMLITGICCSFSNNNLKRGLELLLVAIVVSYVTWIAGVMMGNLDNTFISFGALHCIALTLVFIGLFEKLGLNKWAYLIIAILLFLIGVYFNFIRKGTWVSFSSYPFPSIYFKQMTGQVLIGGDSFDIPFTGSQILFGVFVGKLLYFDRKSLVYHRYFNNPLTFIGRHALVIYVGHQVVLPVLISLIMLMMGYKIDLGL